MFGGHGEGNPKDDTWSFDGKNWTQINPSQRPAPRTDFALASLGNQVVLFGGFTNASGQQNDTWIFDGADWHQAAPSTSPSVRVNHRMVWMPGELRP